MKGWLESKDNTALNLRPYWTFRDDMAVIDGVLLKGRCMVIPNTLQKQALEQHHINHMGRDKTKLITCKSIYWPGIYSNIVKHIKTALHVLNFSKQNQRNK